MIRYKAPIVVLVFLVAGGLLPPVVGAQVTRSVSLNGALERFASENLDLLVARSRAEQARGMARQAAALPNPSLNATHEPLSGGAGTYSETYLTASQRLEFPAARGARRDAGAGLSDAAWAQVGADSLRLAFDVKRAFVDALTAQDRRAVTERITTVFREAARSATERYAAGDASLYSLRRIVAERARYETLLADADLQVGSAQRALALLVSPSGPDERLAAEPLPSEIPPDVDVRRLGPTVVDRRPELAVARAELEVGRAEARLARAERIPNFTATGGLKRQSDGLSGAFLGLSVPLPLFDRGGGSVSAAEAGMRAAEQRETLTRRQLENDLRRSVETYETLRSRMTLFDESGADDGSDLLDIALVAYEEGEMDLVELLDAADALHQARTSESRLRASLWIAYFDLERAVGGFSPSSARED